ncbi:MAG: S-layer homology domain-containing protein [Tissierellia bacterium]|nr:S-layer homology domain-containing protein [Tissierellia bacterium]
MKRRSILVVLLLALLLQPSLALALTFPDISGHWAEKTIMWATDEGYLKGYPDGTFKPNQAITNAEYYRITNQFVQANSSSFQGINAGSMQSVTLGGANPSGPWYQNEIKMGQAAGYLGEDFDDDPNGQITRQEAVRIFAFNAGWEGNEAEAQKFTDVQDIAQGNLAGVGAAVAQGVITGYPDGSFGPNKTLSRAEVVTILGRYLYPNGVPGPDPKPGPSISDWYWMFTNSYGNFEQGYSVLDQHFEEGYKYLSTNDMNIIRSESYGDWGGSCFGFAVTAADYKVGHYTINGLNTPEQTTIGAIQAQDNYLAQSSINFYMLLQFTDQYQQFRDNNAVAWNMGFINNNTNSSGDFANKFVAALDKAKPQGVVLPIGYFTDDFGHAITAFDYEDRGDSVFIKCYDCNAPDEYGATGLLISKTSNRIVAYGSGATAGDVTPNNVRGCYFHEPVRLKEKVNQASKTTTLIAPGGQNVQVSNGSETVNLTPDQGTRSMDGKRVTYNLPAWNRYEFKGPGANNFILQKGEELYVLDAEKLDFAALVDGKIYVHNQTGKYRLLQSRNNPTENFTLDTVEVQGANGGNISFTNTPFGYSLNAKNLQNAEVVGRLKAKESKVPVNVTGEMIMIRDDNGKVVVDDNYDENYVPPTGDIVSGNWMGKGRLEYQGNSLTTESVFFAKKNANGTYRVEKVSTINDPYITEQNGYKYTIIYDNVPFQNGILYLTSDYAVYVEEGFRAGNLRYNYNPNNGRLEQLDDNGNVKSTYSKF